VIILLVTVPVASSASEAGASHPYLTE
jgi:hypothetical protein